MPQEAKTQQNARYFVRSRLIYAAAFANFRPAVGLAQKVEKMPRACPVEPSRSLLRERKLFQMPRACPVEPHVSR